MRFRTICTWRLCACTLVMLAVFGLPLSSAGASPVIAAAANVQFALEDAAAAFTAETGETLKLSFGASGNLYRQIVQGAPFEMFLSADEAYVRRLVEAGLTRDTGTLYALGRLALIAPPASDLRLDPALEGLAQALEARRVSRFAIANPEHAPYGQAARQTLQAAGLWQRLKPHLVLGENVSQAAQFALSGNAEGGIVAYSLALKLGGRASGRYVLLPTRWHVPLRQRMVLLKGAGATARAFYAFLQSPPAQATFRRHGFDSPGS